MAPPPCDDAGGGTVSRAAQRSALDDRGSSSSSGKSYVGSRHDSYPQAKGTMLALFARNRTACTRPKKMGGKSSPLYCAMDSGGSSKRGGIVYCRQRAVLIMGEGHLHGMNPREQQQRQQEIMDRSRDVDIASWNLVLPAKSRSQEGAPDSDSGIHSRPIFFLIELLR